MCFVLQREHYKLDWHRFNLRQKMVGSLPLTAEEFERKTGAGEETADLKEAAEVIVRADQLFLLYRRLVKHLRLRVRFRGRRLGQ